MWKAKTEAAVPHFNKHHVGDYSTLPPLKVSHVQNQTGC